MKKKVIFIGNSIVAGYPWSKGKSFPSCVRRTWAYDTIGLEVINKGVNGDTTAGILGRFQSDVLDHNPDIVFILTGTNDFIYRDATPEEAFSNLSEMAGLLDNAGATTVFMTPVPVDEGKAEFMWMVGMGISYPAVNRDLDILAQLIRHSGRPYVDISRSFRTFAESFDDIDLVYLDGIHPMPEGHEFIGQQVTDKLMELLDKEKSTPHRNDR